MFNRAFNMNDYGYGAALAMVLAGIIAVCTGIFLNRAEKE
jgi:multiple sugar transport system permease protein/raffinose/stachyose/melibiose transport system permease protein